MKLTITKYEVIEILKQKMALPEGIEIEICDAIIPERLKKAIDCIDAKGIRADNKIDCIRTFRSFFNVDNQGVESCDVGLADGKMYIENWTKFKLYVSRHGFMPKNASNTFFENYV